MAQTANGEVALVNTIIDVLSLSPGQARTVGVWAFLAVVALDLAASADNIPLNTPRDWIVSLTQWRSHGLWSGADPTAELSIWQRLMPFNYLPMTGAAVPFAFGTLAGHFFHPDIGILVGPGGLRGLLIVSVLAALVSVATYYGRSGRGPNAVFPLATVGLIAGGALWPVGV